MNRRLGRAAAAMTLAAGAALSSLPATAVEIGGLTINGYGHQMYLRTSANQFLEADKDGSFKNNALALVISASLSPRTKFWTQLATINGDSLSAHYAYVDHAFNDDFSARAGKVLLPIGFYNEIIDARFLQRSGVLPLLYQPETDIVDEAFGGASISWSRAVAGGKLGVDAYGGQIVEHAGAAGGKQKSLFGGRMEFRTPIEGLRLMLSAASKRQVDPVTNMDVTKRTAMLSAEYRRDAWDFKAEFAQMNNSALVAARTTKVYYLQAGYDFSDTWSAFLRNDVLRLPGYSSSNPASYQNSLGLGVTYRVNNGVSLRVEHHFNKGYAMPVLTDETAAGRGKENWQMFGASVNFIF